MTLNNTLANMMSIIYNAEKARKTECSVSPYSKKMERLLVILKANGYIADFKVKHDTAAVGFCIMLNGKINKCGAISPNFNVKKDGFERFEKQYLPAKGFGLLIVTTTKGIMTHDEAKEKGLGGRLIAYCY